MRPQKKIDAEIIIVGGGLAGLTLAASLGAAGLSVVCLEGAAGPRKDSRTTAIAAGPQKILWEAGVWPLIKQSCPILDIVVWDQGSNVELKFDHHEVGSVPFGWIVDNGELMRALTARLSKMKNVRLLTSAVVTTIETNETARVTLADGRVVEGQLVIGADGRRSQCRAMMGLETYGWDYGQTAMVCSVKHSKPHHNLAVELFQPNGPLATLPMLNNHSSIVWTEKRATAAHLMQLPEKEFVAALQEHVGDWLGEIKLASAVQSFPLNLVHAKKYTARRFALINEAAHGIHPIAGQGLNLGMRDIADLRDELVRAASLGMDFGDAEILRRYENVRRRDNGKMIMTTDLLVRLFSNSVPAVQAARRFGLGLVQNIPPARRFFMRQAMGRAS